MSDTPLGTYVEPLRAECDRAWETVNMWKLTWANAVDSWDKAVNELMAERDADKQQVESLRAELAALQKQRVAVEVAAAVIERDGLFRIFKRGGNDSYTGKWEFPGGKLDPGESAADALRRELKEELGVDAVIGEVLDRYIYEYPKRRPIDLTFFAVTLAEEPKLLEHTASAWVSAADLSQYDLMNGDMRFVASRIRLAAEKQRADALEAALNRAIKALQFAGQPESRAYHFRELTEQLSEALDAAQMGAARKPVPQEPKA